MSFVQGIVATTQRLVEPSKKKKAKRIRRREARFDRFITKWRDVTTWNCQDLVTYYQLLFRSKYGRIPMVRLVQDSACMRRLRSAFRNNNEAKLALQIYITRSDEPPLTIGYVTSARAIEEIKNHWDEPLSRKVTDDYVFAQKRGFVSSFAFE